MPDATPKFENIPPLDKYWDSPTQSAQGSESADLIFISVGHALTTWEWVESIFSILFTELVEGESDAAKRVYGLMTSTAQKQAAIIAAAEIYKGRHPDEFPSTELKLLLAHYAKASARRNEIAHGTVGGFDINGRVRQYFLTPAIYNTKKNAAQTPEFWADAHLNMSVDEFAVFGLGYRYTHDDILKIDEKFSSLSRQVVPVWNHLQMKRVQKRFDATPAENKASIRLG